jgi:hypothetical protein
VFVELNGSPVLDVSEAVLLQALTNAWLQGGEMHLVMMPAMVAVLMCNPWPVAINSTSSTNNSNNTSAGGGSGATTNGSSGADADDGSDDDVAGDEELGTTVRAAIGFFKLGDSLPTTDDGPRKKSFISLSGTCAFWIRNLHSRMPLVPMPARLKLLHACDQ